ncbi:hypothetical protein BDE40_1713 [Litoreibacter halocynthiae]|uniref:Uncharacterized protein n=1 Tax=Litoreibacter halocynthiae TaxID=1242689 RepID=A0A4R7LLJ8_9RHOB|nr:hypothetical protein [Litoreibacter halocynthiae]TDT74990.1 hypothetical protein BDE40_1713 [Litoreibacter halocynthiae]
MTKFFTTTAIALTFAAPAFADINVEEYLALSNNSAAERLVEETSTGDVEAAEIKFALGNMSAAERQVFFEMDEESRMAQLIALRKTAPMNSPAEAAASN